MLRRIVQLRSFILIDDLIFYFIILTCLFHPYLFVILIFPTNNTDAFIPQLLM